MSNRKNKATISDVLRQAITASGKTYLELERETGVHRASIMRFVTGERTLRLDMADKLTDCLGIVASVRPKRS
ncbi:MAG: hypothetical protein DCC65_04710 [Planctomycetota bacterium]|nr:MAG: hypothetical protein DCC65_04710 [Planctomycetota bacterium]